MAPMNNGIIPPPTNSLVTPLLTDLYQVTMAYAYWKGNRHDDCAVFELFFRKNPFGGEYTIFCGLDEVLKHLANFKFSHSDLEYLRCTPPLQHCHSDFFDLYLKNLDCAEVRVEAMQEGSVAFPRVPMLIVSGPLGITQLLETTLLTLINYPSLVATNATRMVVAARGQSGDGNTFTTNGAAGTKKTKIPRCIEFGLRRAQGPDGGFSASKYSAVGGFDATSNVQAGKLLDVSISGTHAHAFVQCYSTLDDIKGQSLKRKDGSNNEEELLPLVLKYRKDLGNEWMSTNDGELAAFIAYATAFPDGFLCLIDTYDTLRSGLRNFVMVALVLHDLGYIPKGIRLDSGDLSYLSLEAKKLFEEMAEKLDRLFFYNLDIVASNDINEDVLHSLNKQGHGITVFGIGTNLVTCQAQPALGCVYKLVDLNKRPRIKLSEDFEKVIIPGRKVAYRLFGQARWPLLDLMLGHEEDPPKVGTRVLCRHPFIEQKRVYVIPSRVEKLHILAFDGKKGVVIEMPCLTVAKKFVAYQIKCMRSDILRPVNPGQYKVSVSESLFNFLHDLWQSETPVLEIY